MHYPAKVLTRHEIEALLQACGTDSWTDRRNYALIVLLWRTGLRIAEALALRPCDVDLERGAIRVLRGKGVRTRRVGIDRIEIEAMRAWVDEHRAMGHGAGGPLLVTGSGRGMMRGYLRRKIPELGRAAGIAKRVHAHGLRHIHASELRAEGIGTALIQQQLGHSSLLTTVSYVQHLMPNTLFDAMIAR